MYHVYQGDRPRDRKRCSLMDCKSTNKIRNFKTIPQKSFIFYGAEEKSRTIT